MTNDYRSAWCGTSRWPWPLGAVAILKILAILAILASTGCAGGAGQRPKPAPTEPTEARTPKASERAAVADAPKAGWALGLDQRFDSIAARVPEFAGLTLDSANTALVVALADLAAEPRARAALPALLDQYGFIMGRAHPLQFRRVAFRWTDLRAWQRALVPGVLTAATGLRGMDLDEGRNVLHLVVADEAAARRVRAALPTLGVPAGALRISVWAGIKR